MPGRARSKDSFSFTKAKCANKDYQKGGLLFSEIIKDFSFSIRDCCTQRDFSTLKNNYLENCMHSDAVDIEYLLVPVRAGGYAPVGECSARSSDQDLSIHRFAITTTEGTVHSVREYDSA
jgi:hypothetical protein